MVRSSVVEAVSEFVLYCDVRCLAPQVMGHLSDYPIRQCVTTVAPLADMPNRHQSALLPSAQLGTTASHTAT